MLSFVGWIGDAFSFFVNFDEVLEGHPAEQVSYFFLQDVFEFSFFDFFGHFFPVILFDDLAAAFEFCWDAGDAHSFFHRVFFFSIAQSGVDCSERETLGHCIGSIDFEVHGSGVLGGRSTHTTFLLVAYFVNSSSTLVRSFPKYPAPKGPVTNVS